MSVTSDNNPVSESAFDLDTFLQCEPFIHFLNESYFHTQVIGMENIPSQGRAILVGNHSGVLPIDGLLFYYAYYNLRRKPRRIRFLAHDWLFTTPLISQFVSSIGAVKARYFTARKLLNNDELVFFYPEGARGTGKPFSMRYRLCDFDPGFVKAAIETNSPLVPIIIVGGDEIYPLVGNCKQIADLMGTPYWPVGLTFPWLPFPLSMAPLPVRILIKVLEPIFLKEEKSSARDRTVLLKIARSVQYRIQSELNSLLRKRKSPFSKW